MALPRLAQPVSKYAYDMGAASPNSAERFLATAYDTDWVMKKTPPKDCIPPWTKRRSMRAQVPPPRLSRSSVSRKTPSTLQMAGRSGSSTPSTRSCGSLTPSTRSCGSSRPSSTGSCGTINPLLSSPKPTTPPRNHRSQKNMRLSASLPSLVLTDDRPQSAGSEKKEENDESTDRENGTNSKNNDTEREEKSLQAHAADAGVPFDIAIQALECFLTFVSNKPHENNRKTRHQILNSVPFDACEDLGSMDTAAFGKACLKIADCNDFSSLPYGFLDKAMHSADIDGSGDIDFGEFLAFYYQFSFSEEVLIGPDERLLRAAARHHMIPYDEISKYKRAFDQTDSNKNGMIEYDEFCRLLHRLMQVPRGQSLPANRTKEMWREALRTCLDDSRLDFGSFIGWYKKCFIADGFDNGESPFEAYYHNIRRVSVYRNSNF